jgi:hypothetical protein
VAFSSSSASVRRGRPSMVPRPRCAASVSAAMAATPGPARWAATAPVLRSAQAGSGTGWPDCQKASTEATSASRPKPLQHRCSIAVAPRSEKRGGQPPARLTRPEGRSTSSQSAGRRIRSFLIAQSLNQIDVPHPVLWTRCCTMRRA